MAYVCRNTCVKARNNLVVHPTLQTLLCALLPICPHRTRHRVRQTNGSRVRRVRRQEGVFCHTEAVLLVDGLPHTVRRGPGVSGEPLGVQRKVYVVALCLVVQEAEVRVAVVATRKFCPLLGISLAKPLLTGQHLPDPLSRPYSVQRLAISQGFHSAQQNDRRRAE